MSSSTVSSVILGVMVLVLSAIVVQQQITLNSIRQSLSEQSHRQDTLSYELDTFQQTVNEKFQVRAQAIETILAEQAKTMAEDLELRVLYKIRNNKEEIDAIRNEQKGLSAR